MNPTDPSERVARMKKILADSYPRVAEPHLKEPLPASARAALAGNPRTEPKAVSTFEKLLSLLRGPQLTALGAAAMLVIAAIVLTRPPAGIGNNRDTMRSGGGSVSEPSIIVLHSLTEAQSAALRSSGYFRPGQLLAAPADVELSAFLESNRRPNLILADGDTGEITAPFAGEDAPAPVSFASQDDDLAPLLLDMLAKLPEPGK